MIVKGIVITCLLSMLTTTLFAQKPNKSNHLQGANQEQTTLLLPGAPGTPPPPPPPPPPIPPATDLPDSQLPPPLNLPDITPEQQEKIHLAGLDHIKMMTPLHNQVREKKARLQTVLTSPSFDAKTADQVAEELGKIETGILKEMIRHDQALRNILSPQQQVVFDARPKPFLHRKR